MTEVHMNGEDKERKFLESVNDLHNHRHGLYEVGILWIISGLGPVLAELICDHTAKSLSSYLIWLIVGVQWIAYVQRNERFYRYLENRNESNGEKEIEIK